MRRFKRHFCIFLVLLTMVFASVGQPSVGSVECSGEFAKIWRLNEELEEKIKLRTEFARGWYRQRLRQMNSNQNAAYARRGRPDLQFGEIDPLDPSLIPKDAKLASVADRVNFLFQDPRSIESYLAALTEDSARYLVHRGILTSAQSPEKSLIRSSDMHLDFLKALAAKNGWSKIHVEEEVSTPQRFRTQVLGRGELWFDLGGEEIGHTASAHLLQWTYITPILEKEFGAGTAKSFLNYLATSEGFKLWENLFDRGPGHVRDLRGPIAFSELRAAGQGMNWTGLP